MVNQLVSDINATLSEAVTIRIGKETGSRLLKLIRERYRISRRHIWW